LEIGPGTGVLTRELLARGYQVTAVETDPRALYVLQDTFVAEVSKGALTLVEADARELNLKALGFVDHSFSVIANIPYYLSGLLLRTLLAGSIQPKTLVFLMQKELVERIARSAKSSLLSISVAVFGSPTYVQTIKRGHFQPPPAVDSAILLVKHINR
jgi:16S rRNA (adenine1518-N6/adenine1519-N6)-dimethyltransferase